MRRGLLLAICLVGIYFLLALATWFFFFVRRRSQETAHELFAPA